MRTFEICYCLFALRFLRLESTSKRRLTIISFILNTFGITCFSSAGRNYGIGRTINALQQPFTVLNSDLRARNNESSRLNPHHADAERTEPTGNNSVIFLSYRFSVDKITPGFKNKCAVECAVS